MPPDLEWNILYNNIASTTPVSVSDNQSLWVIPPQSAAKEYKNGFWSESTATYNQVPYPDENKGYWDITGIYLYSTWNPQQTYIPPNSPNQWVVIGTGYANGTTTGTQTVYYPYVTGNPDIDVPWISTSPGTVDGVTAWQYVIVSRAGETWLGQPSVTHSPNSVEGTYIGGYETVLKLRIQFQSTGYSFYWKVWEADGQDQSNGQYAISNNCEEGTVWDEECQDCIPVCLGDILSFAQALESDAAALLN